MIFVLLVWGGAQAQDKPTQDKPTSEPQGTDAALRQKAYDLLESLAGDVGTLQSAENRARLGSNLAAWLWNHDEKRARSLLLAVETDVRAGFQKLAKGDRADAMTRLVFLKLRADTAKRIAEHDAETALAFLTATEPEADTTEGDEEFAATERSLKLQLANDLISQKPEIAVKLARQSLARGLSFELLSLLRKLQRRDKEQSQVLYKEIVAKLRENELGPGVEALYFAMRLARAFKPPAADEQTFRELIQLFISAALANGCDKKSSDEDNNRWFCSEIGSMISEMEKVDPAHAAQLKQWAPEEPESRYSPEAYEELEALGEEGTLDDILAIADKYPYMKDQVYWKAFEKAIGSGDVERARKIAGNVEEDYIHQLMVKRLEGPQMWDSLNDQKLAELQKAVNAIPDREGRIELVLAVASRLGATDRKTALKLLDQASVITDTMKPGRDQTHAQIALAILYCQEKSDRGLTIMQNVLPKLNELISAAAKLDGYDTNNLREGEWNMSNQGNIGALLTELSQNAGHFAWYDFDRSVSLAAQFERPEIRLMAQLKLAQAILAGRPGRFLTYAWQ